MSAIFKKNSSFLQSVAVRQDQALHDLKKVASGSYWTEICWTEICLHQLNGYKCAMRWHK